MELGWNSPSRLSRLLEHWGLIENWWDTSHEAPGPFRDAITMDPPDEWRLVSENDAGLALYERPTGRLPAPTASAHRPATVFENELDDMTETAVEVLPALLGTETVTTEMPYQNQYRTDLALCSVDRAALGRRLRMMDGPARLDEEWKFLRSYWWAGHHAPLTRAEFVEDGPLVEQTMQRVVRWLEDQNLLATTPQAYLTPIEYPVHITAHAVELKPRDWETALDQAARADGFDYSEKWGYADYRWVCMDAGQIPEVLPHREAFREAGVGLIGLDRGGAVILEDAEESDPPDRALDRLHLNEKTLGQLDVDGEWWRPTLDEREDTTTDPDDAGQQVPLHASWGDGSGSDAE